MQTTIEAATGFAPGHAAAGGIISAPVAALTQGVLKAMFWTKCKLVATVILTTTALGLGSGALAWQRGGTGAGEEPSTPVAQAPQGEGAKPNDERSGAKEKADGTSDVAPMSTEVWEEWATLKGHLVKDKAKPVLSASFSPDGKTLATANSDGAVWLWDVAIGARVDQKPQRVILAEGIDVRSHAVRAVLFSPDGTRLSAGADKTIKLWDVKSGKDLIGFQEHKDNILGLAFSPDGKTLASTSADGTTRLTETTTGKVVFETAVQSARILTVAFSPDGKSLALANAEPELLLLDLKTGQVIRRLRGHAREIHSLAISPNGKLLATASRDKTIRLWDLASGKELRQISSSDEAVKSVMFSPDGKLLVTGGQDKTVRILDHTTGMLVATLTGHTGPVYCVMFSPDGKTIASASEDGTVKLWSAKRVVVERSGAVTPAAKGDHLDKLLDDLIKAKKTDDQIVEALYLATLARLPLENEKAFVLKHLEKQGERRQAALTDVLFTLTNSKEFSANLDALKQRDSRRGK